MFMFNVRKVVTIKFEMRYQGAHTTGEPKSKANGTLSPSSAHPLSLIKIRDSKTTRDASQNKPL